MCGVALLIESGETKGTKQIVAQMENMSKPNQFAFVEFNGDFFRFVTMSQGMLAFADPEVERQFLPPESDDTTLGQALRRSLGKSRSVSVDEFQRIFKSGQVQQVEKQNASFMMQTYGYKIRKAMLQHMKTCTVSSSGSAIEIQPTHRDSLETHRVHKSDSLFPLMVENSASDRDLGAALRQAVRKCTDDAV